MVDHGRLQDQSTNALLFAVAARIAIHRGDRAHATNLVTQAQRLRPGLTHTLPYLAVQTRLELIRALLALADAPGARTVLREVDAILRLRPALGVLSEQTEELRAQIARIPVGTVGASTLTGAELRLLPLLQTHRTFREIAERLYVSPHTVKTQAISIYRKLGVSSRSDAVERAAELGLLSL
jgi:LuxR family maltose regulon positive regulatory protein